MSLVPAPGCWTATPPFEVIDARIGVVAPTMPNVTPPRVTVIAGASFGAAAALTRFVRLLWKSVFGRMAPV